jgi:hypothetical protein
LKTYFENKLREVIKSQNLKSNKLIMEDKDLAAIINSLWIN